MDFKDIILPGIAALAIASSAKAQSPSNAKSIVSYIIYQDNELTKAINSNGTVEYSSADSTDTILYTIDTLSMKGGGTVFIRAGTYLITRTLHTASNVALVGESASSTILKLTDFANTKMVDDITIQTDITLCNITFDANGTNQTDSTELIPNRSDRLCIRLKQKTRLILDNIIIKNTRTGAGLNLGSCENVKVTNSMFIDNGVFGGSFISDHFFSTYTNDILIQGCSFINCTDVGSAQDFNSNSRIIGCYYEGCKLGAFTWTNPEGPTLSPAHMVVDSCNIDATGTNTGFYTNVKGIQTNYPEKVIISNCTIKGGNVGARIQHTKQIKIVNCHIHLQTQASIAITNSIDCEVSGCTIENSPKGIDLSIKSDNVRIHNNNFVGTPIPINNNTGSTTIVNDNYGLSPFNWDNLASAPTSFGKGDEYFDTTLNRKLYFNGTIWT